MMEFSKLQQINIEHKFVTIRNYQAQDFDGLNAVFNVDLLTWFFTRYDNCREFVAEKLAEVKAGNLAFLVIIDNKLKKIIGTSSLYDISLEHKRLEIGASWLAEEYHGSGYNSLNKYLLMDYLINQMGFNRITLKTDVLNEKSKNAMQKLGFVCEGIFKRHIITHSGRVRDSAIFSVTDTSWRDVAQIMQNRIKEQLHI